MNVKTFCPHCNQPIEYDGEYAGVNVDCPNCSGQVYLPKMESPKSPPPVIQQPITQLLVPKQKTKLTTWIVLGFILLFGIICISTNNDSTNTTVGNIKTYKYPSYVYVTTKLIPKFLKSPSTAKFSEFENTYVKLTTNGTYEVNGYYDSQNSFGAMLRGYYDCEVSVTPVDDENVRVIPIHIKLWESDGTIDINE